MPKIWLHITGANGVDAEFLVDSAAMAVDFVLRSQRASLCWRAELRSEPAPRPLSLADLRQLAVEHAQTPEQRELLDHIEWQHEVQRSFSLN